VVAERPQVARLDVDLRVGRDGRDVVDVPNDAPDPVAVGEVGEQSRERRVVGLDVREECRERLLLGGGHRRQGIEAGQDESLLLLTELDIDDGHGRFTARERQFDAQMPVDHVPGRAVDRICPTQPTSDNAPASACCCSFGCTRQFAGFARSCSAARRRGRRSGSPVGGGDLGHEPCFLSRAE
jgi:hypothetical protein